MEKNKKVLLQNKKKSVMAKLTNVALVTPTPVAPFTSKV